MKTKLFLRYIYIYEIFSAKIPSVRNIIMNNIMYHEVLFSSSNRLSLLLFTQ